MTVTDVIKSNLNIFFCIRFEEFLFFKINPYTVDMNNKNTRFLFKLSVFVFLLLSIITTLSLSAEETINKTVSADVFFPALEQQRSEGSGILLDVRTPGEYTDGNAPTSINIDYYDRDFQSKVSALDRDETYFLYCHSGNRSGRTLSIMKNLGFQHVYDLSGGWSRNSTRLLAVEEQ